MGRERETVSEGEGSRVSRQMLVVLHPHRERARAAAVRVCRALVAEGVVPVLTADHHAAVLAAGGAGGEAEAVLPAEVRIVPAPEPGTRSEPAPGQHPAAADGCELIIVLGGDGTILRAAEVYHRAQVPIMGVNLGHVGFLAESESDDIDEAVRRAVAREYDIESRLTLDITVRLGSELVHRAWALNEATVEKGPGSQMIELSTGVDDRPVSTYGCDGVIMATPTGSTAYAFSAGGPIVWPDVEALLMVPISAHALFAEPLVVSRDSVIAVEYLPRPAKDSAVLWCDGRQELELPVGAHIEACRSATPLLLARLRHGPFTDRLVKKFQLPVAGWRGPAAEAR
ncbi:NAD kinase [Brevibacterium salitolerans]|uniref:NAD kinase n=2 Tax=Brevibacterium TaxID=1696 RepID=A0ABN2XB88_9MICO